MLYLLFIYLPPHSWETLSILGRWGIAIIAGYFFLRMLITAAQLFKKILDKGPHK